MKDRAINTTEKTRDIIRNGIANENEDILADLPTVCTLPRDIQRQRHKANIIVPMPDDNDFHFVLPQRQRLGKLIPILEEDC